jgi:hypothetical protein
MAEIDDLSARLTALETVIGHLITHMAVRDDDPPRWVETRRVLALHALRDHPLPAIGDKAFVDSVQTAIAGLFDQVEDVVANYARATKPERKGTARVAGR